MEYAERDRHRFQPRRRARARGAPKGQNPRTERQNGDSSLEDSRDGSPSPITCCRSRHNRRLRLRAYCEAGEPPMLDSVIEIWKAADWYEREAFDLYGIVFRGHPDLRRILTDYGFIGHPFRKDFPLIGNVEVRYDPAKGRVVYEPVTIEPRTLVPKVIREDNRYGTGAQGHAHPWLRSTATR